MRISIDRQSKTPLYKQIAAYFRQAILSGSIEPNTRLPASRQLAADLGVNRLTIENAFAELESDGLVYSVMGSGTYSLAPFTLKPDSDNGQTTAWPLWQQELAEQNQSGVGTAVDRFNVNPEAGLLNFAVGIGDSSLFPVEDFRKILQSSLRRHGKKALEYGDSQGYPPLRRVITQILASQGLNVSPDNILVTAGSQQGISLAAQLLLKAGDTILVEDPTYADALDLFLALNLKIVGVPCGPQGMQTALLENLLQKYHPKLIYTIPNFHNPTSSCLDITSRQELISLAEKYNIPILEDDFVGDLRYSGFAIPALKSLDPGGRVIYTSTFSKMLMPGLRVGFLAVEGPVFEALVAQKRAFDLTTSNLIQRALEAYVSVGRYQSHLRKSCRIYKKRRDTMLEAVQKYLPKDVFCAEPDGGLFLWIKLGEGLTSSSILPAARKKGIVFAPGRKFFINPQDGESYMRLNFAAFEEEDIKTGFKKLGEVLTEKR